MIKFQQLLASLGVNELTLRPWRRGDFITCRPGGLARTDAMVGCSVHMFVMNPDSSIMAQNSFAI